VKRKFSVNEYTAYVEYEHIPPLLCVCTVSSVTSRSTNYNISHCTLHFSGASAKLGKATVSFAVSLSARPPAHPHAATLLLLNGFSRNLTFEYFSKIGRKNFSFVKI
jgi:hypothetical protein